MTHGARFSICCIIFASASLRAGKAEAQWTQTNGPEGGSVNLSVFGDTLYAASSYGVYRSTDAGRMWLPINAGLPNQPHFGDVVRLGSDIYFNTDSGVYKYAANASSWQRVNLNGYLLGSIGSIWLAEDNGAAFGIDRSTDSGRSWVFVPTTKGERFFSFSIGGSNVYGTDYDGRVLRSTDSGQTWITVDYEKAAPYSPPTVVAHGSTVLLGAPGGGLLGTGGIYRSTDFGTTWNEANAGIAAPGYVSAMGFLGNELFVATGPSYLLANPQAIYESTDSGATWQLVNDSLINVGVLQADGSELVAGTSYGVFVSEDSGRTWISRNTGMVASSVVAMCTGSGNLYAAANYGVSKTSDDGGKWTDVSLRLPITPTVDRLAAGDNSLYSTNAFGALYLSTNEGDTWDSLENPTGGISSLVIKSNNLYVGSEGGNYYRLPGGVFQTSDNGLHWQTLNTGLPSQPIVTSLLVSNMGFFAGTLGKWIFRSADGGIHWILSDTLLAPDSSIFIDSSYYVTSLVAYDGSIFAGGYPPGAYPPPFFSYPTLLVSKDSGRTWMADSGYQFFDHGEVFFDHPNAFASIGGYLVAMTSGNIYLTSDTGQTWEEVDWGLPTSVGFGSIESLNDTLFVGTEGAGVWDCPLSGLLALSDVSEPETHGEIAEAYPNPFTVACTIHFTTAESVPTHVSIENILGDPIARLFAGELGAGEHSFTWNAQNAPDGIYFAVIRMGTSVQRVALSLAR